MPPSGLASRNRRAGGDQWGPKGTFFNNWAAAATDYGLYAILLVVMIVTYLQRSINNLVGPVRD